MVIEKKRGYEIGQPLDYTQIIFEQIRETAQSAVRAPHRYFSSVMVLKTLLTPYIITDAADKKIKEIADARNASLKEQPEKKRKDSNFMVEWNSATAEMIFEELMLLISRCGFLPAKVVDLILHKDSSWSIRA